MFDFLSNMIPVRTLFGLAANQIAAQTGFPCDKFSMIYIRETNDLSFVVTYPDGSEIRHGYDEGTAIGKAIQMQALGKLPKNAELDIVVTRWHRTDETQCIAEIYYKENGVKESLKTPY